MFGEINKKKAKRRTKIGEIGCVIFVIMFVGTTILNKYSRPQISKDIQFIFFAAGQLAFTYSICLLRRSLRMFDDPIFVSETKSING